MNIYKNIWKLCLFAHTASAPSPLGRNCSTFHEAGGVRGNQVLFASRLPSLAYLPRLVGVWERGPGSGANISEGKFKQEKPGLGFSACNMKPGD